jgi:hypothetical protein
MGVSVFITRPGKRVKLRRHCTSNVGKKHMLTPEVTVPFVKETLGVEIT